MTKLLLTAGFSLSLCGCLNLDITECVLDVKAMKAYCNPTKPSATKKSFDLDLTKKEDLLKLHKFTCVSPDDFQIIEHALNGK